MWCCKSSKKMNIMTKLTDKNRRESTLVRDIEVCRIYNQVLDELGELKNAVSKSYIYEKVRSQTKLSIRTISFIVNHTRTS